nr:RNA-processing protein, HAT helix [Tanacetum cinerariifolium]
MPNVDIPQGIDTGGSPRCQETMGGTPAQTRSERVLEQPNEPPLSEGHTSGSEEGRMEHTFELMDTAETFGIMNICTTLSNRVTTLENKLSSTKAVYHKAFITLTKRVKKLETHLNQKRSIEFIHSSDEEEPSLDIEDSPKQGRMIGEIEKDDNVNLVSEQGEVRETAKPLKDDDDATIAKTLLNIKRSTTKDKGKESVLALKMEAMSEDEEDGGKKNGVEDDGKEEEDGRLNVGKLEEKLKKF